jgi:hypothetical protein
MHEVVRMARQRSIDHKLLHDGDRRLPRTYIVVVARGQHLYLQRRSNG